MNSHNQKLCSRRKGNNEKNSVQVIEQREQSQNSSKIEDILNHPVLKRRLPPIERRQNNEENEEEKAGNEENNNNVDMNLEEIINNNIQQLNKEKEPEIKDDIKDSLELDLENEKKEEINTIDNAEKEKENNLIEEKITNEIGTGTPYYCENIQDLKNEVDNKTKIISKLSDEQNEYKFKLNELFQKLNKLLTENVEILYKEEDDEDSKKIENLNELKLQLEKRIKGINSSKNQNKIYKKQRRGK